MNLNVKIVSLIVLSFFVVAGILTYVSVSHLKQNQTGNIAIFKAEFLEICRELFGNSSALFFDDIDEKVYGRRSGGDSRSAVMEALRRIDPASDHTVVYDIATRKIIVTNTRFTDLGLVSEEVLDGYAKENILNQRTDFDVDNFNQFQLDETGEVVPVALRFKVYKDAGLIVGDMGVFLSGKVRIEFVKRQNNEHLLTTAESLAVISLSVLFIIVIMMIVFMQRIVIKPLKTIASRLGYVERGDLETRLGINSSDEIGKISSAFNSMVFQLKTSTHRLIEEKARLLASVNSLSFGFLIVDMEHNVLLNNKAVIDLFGFKDEIVSIKKISGLLGGFDIEAEAGRCLKGKLVCEIKEMFLGKKVLRGLVAPIVTNDVTGEKIGYVLLLEDVTEAKVMERSRDEFFAIASHELRTPLTAIRGNCSLILENYSDKVTDPEVREMLKDVDASSVRLIEIVNDFLEVSRLEQGRFEIKSTIFDISEVVAKVSRDLQGMFMQRNVLLEVPTVAQNMPYVYADRERVEEVLVNLIGNSLKFTNDGKVTVLLEASDRFVTVFVKDTGIGISEQNQSRLFRKFQQAGESMIARDVTQGTGLGLYISQLLVSNMGGSLGLVSSELGKGSTFAFTVPVAPKVD